MVLRFLYLVLVFNGLKSQMYADFTLGRVFYAFSYDFSVHSAAQLFLLMRLNFLQLLQYFLFLWSSVRLACIMQTF